MIILWIILYSRLYSIWETKDVNSRQGRNLLFCLMFLLGITMDMKLSLNKTLTLYKMVTDETKFLWNVNIAKVCCSFCIKTVIAHFIHCGFSSNSFYGILHIVWFKKLFSFYDFLNKKEIWSKKEKQILIHHKNINTFLKRI